MTASELERDVFMRSFRRGDVVIVVLPDDIESWAGVFGDAWKGTVVYVSGDSVDGGTVEPVDSEYVARAAGRVTVRRNIYREWHVRVWDANGRRWPEADAFEDSKEAAEETAAALLRWPQR